MFERHLLVGRGHAVQLRGAPCGHNRFEQVQIPIDNRRHLAGRKRVSHRFANREMIELAAGVGGQPRDAVVARLDFDVSGADEITAGPAKLRRAGRPRCWSCRRRYPD